MPEIRRDPLTGRLVILARERAGRPNEFRDDVAACPFCPGNESATPPEVQAVRPDAGMPDGPGWQVRVVPNRYPALAPCSPGSPGSPGPFFLALPGTGHHEVIIDTPVHRARLASLGPHGLGRLLAVWRDRMRVLGGRPGVQAVVLFRNDGADAGASLVHPHSQVLALPVIPPRHAVPIDRPGVDPSGCATCTLVAAEERAGVRVVGASGLHVALAAWAPRLPFELLVLPREHGTWFAGAGDRELADAAALLASVLARLDRELDDPPVNLVISEPSASPGEGDATGSVAGGGFGPAGHWRLELLPRTTPLGGLELGTGMHINTMPPEEAARRLRESPA